MVGQQNHSGKGAAKLIQFIYRRRQMKAFAKRHNLLYFGSVNPRDDNYQIVRGITAGPDRKDLHYTVGTVEGRDIIVFERRAQLKGTGQKVKEYSWTIIQLDLKRSNLPHVFIDRQSQSSSFYNHVLSGMPSMQDMTDYLRSPAAAAPSPYRITANPSKYEELIRLFTVSLVDYLERTKHYCYEVSDDSLIVYAAGSATHAALMGDMLTDSLRLAKLIDT